MFMTMVAMDNTKAYKEACEIMDWYMTIVDATSTDRSKNSYLSKMKIMGPKFLPPKVIKRWKKRWNT